MKFLIINRPDGGRKVRKNPEGTRKHANSLKELLKSKEIECAYALIGGGGAYVVEAKDTRELAIMVRENPLFEQCTTDVIPVANAVEFLEGHASYIEKR